MFGLLLALAGVDWFVIPPLSNIPRLPDAVPADGVRGGSLGVIACRDEFEPASFELVSDRNLEGVSLEASDLRADGGAIIPKSKVDLKVVKVWYQCGNSWYTYFCDPGLKLCPDLLLNDENLIRVDEKKKANFVRVRYDGKEDYVWVSPPTVIDPGFRKWTEPVDDAETLQPFALEKGRYKQFFATFRIDRDAKPGLYRGSVRIKDREGGLLGEIPVRLRVMKHVLPAPKTYYDLNADFYTMLYMPGADCDDAKLRKRLQNWYDHNVRNPLYFGLGFEYKGLERTEKGLAMAKEIGMQLDPFFEAWFCARGATAEFFCRRKREGEIANRELGRILGHHNLYVAGGEEPPPWRVVESRNGWRIAHEEGNLVMCNGRDRRHYCGYSDDFRIGSGFMDREQADFMHRIRGKIGNYAGPHTGPENPDYMRRMSGLNLYKKDCDMMYNYCYVEGQWNDLRSGCWRITLVYETRGGYIDTLPWEGVREGIDDIRYATLLMQLADRAVKEGKQKNVDRYYAGRKALQFLANLNEERCDLPAARLEILNHIDRLDAVLAK